MPEIREISSTETYVVRHPVLRPGKPMETCRFDGDDLGNTTHFGLYENGEIAGVASLFRNSHPAFNEFRQFQLRGMAVLEEFQGRSFGQALVDAAEDKARRAAADLIWFNARLIAVGFYEKMGYKITGKPFEIGDIGPHYVMFKRM
ncbi:GNAT family N-acetyltransferase [Flavobacterium sp. MAH-1]|uniref:GNAT family N-acetyltransferase n=1 Tax=Flavobacterium agri TaxID=2743471 RepID=A0A7Y9C666_9FLAO|nr:GNAT family N-acetyltransferase [Flavobacterium agri]NUY81691.1 GNAT family N-acetyltransferase [Flavobacterium agri]NYA71715.1 GNAT family N-acetyltransferase [Flavobacterium agri]